MCYNAVRSFKVGLNKFKPIQICFYMCYWVVSVQPGLNCRFYNRLLATVNMSHFVACLHSLA